MTALLLSLALLAAPETRALVVDPARSEVHYDVHHKLHDVEGRTRQIEGKAVIAPDGAVQAMFRIPVATFDSGDANRDVNMRETLQAAKFPFVVFKGVTRLPETRPAEGVVKAKVDGELELHGVKQRVSAPAEVEFMADGTVRVRSAFSVSLEAFHVERPSLLLVKLDDDCRIAVDLLMREAKP